MLIEIRLLARLLRIPLLRVEGVVAIRDVEAAGVMGREVGEAAGNVSGPTLGARGIASAASPFGRDLAAAEAILAGLDVHH